jgi:ParB/RepB/Spo0J family partition protein
VVDEHRPIEVVSVSTFKCRMWSMHDRLGEQVSESGCASLIASIRKHGQKQPVLGRPCSGGSGEIELIYGARRLFAARHLGVPLLVELRCIDDRTALIEMDIENRVRRDITPYERGLSYTSWLRAGYFANQSELAKNIGVSEAQVSRLLRYAEIPTVVLGAFRSPADIREDWAVELARACRDPSHRGEIIRRARQVQKAAKVLRPRIAYERLMGLGRRNGARTDTMDEIVRDSSGTPMFRVRYRRAFVHLMIPRASLETQVLTAICSEVKSTIERSGSASRFRSGDRDVRSAHGEGMISGLRALRR